MVELGVTEFANPSTTSYRPNLRTESVLSNDNRRLQLLFLVGVATPRRLVKTLFLDLLNERLNNERLQNGVKNYVVVLKRYEMTAGSSTSVYRGTCNSRREEK